MSPLLKKYGLLLLIILELPLVLIAKKLQSSDLDAPRLDLWVILLSFLFNLVMLIIGFRKWNTGRIPKLYLPAVVVSTLLLRFWMVSKR